MLKNLKSNKSWFTLIEMLIVLVIIGAIIVFVLSRITNIGLGKPEENLPTLEGAYFNNFNYTYNDVNAIAPVDMPTLWTDNTYLKNALTVAYIAKWKIKVKLPKSLSVTASRFFWWDSTIDTWSISKRVTTLVNSLKKINDS